jgi:hypothetical protein
MTMKLITCSALAMAVALAACGGYTPIGEGEPVAGAGGTMPGSGGTVMTGGSSGSTMTGGTGGTTMTGGTGGMTMTGGTGGTGGTTMTGGTGGTGGGYDPCSNHACGTQCSVCAPGDMNCAADAVITYCDAGGNCTPNFPMCDPGQCETAMDCPLLGLPCEMCSNGGSACPTTACVMGQCVTTYPTCQPDACMTDVECPVSDAPCTMCADGTTECPWSKCVNGQCTTGTDSCGTTAPCEGKSCGDFCNPCAGDNCDAAAPIMAAAYCNEHLECQFNVPMCGAEMCMADTDCAAPEICMACADTGKCAQMKCVNGGCQWQCGGSMDPCGGCGEQSCVYQLGGPGPSHYVCAPQTVCDAADPCACVQGQGTCHKDASTGYCHCENGLE